MRISRGTPRKLALWGQTGCRQCPGTIGEVVDARDPLRLEREYVVDPVGQRHILHALHVAAMNVQDHMAFRSDQFYGADFAVMRAARREVLRNLRPGIPPPLRATPLPHRIVS